MRDHEEVFGPWQETIDDDMLQPLFHVTHVDAHGDLSERKTGLRGVFDVLGLPVEDRAKRSRGLLVDGDYLGRAVVCQWILHLTTSTAQRADRTSAPGAGELPGAKFVHPRPGDSSSPSTGRGDHEPARVA